MKYLLEEYTKTKITPATISRMHELVKQAKTDPIFISLIIFITKKCPARDDMCAAKRLYRVFFKKIKYVRDPHQVEKIQSVWSSLKNRAADCDCSSILMAAAFGALGYRYRFVTIKCDPGRKGDWSHVFTQVSIPGHGWTTVDITLRSNNFGFTPTGWLSKFWDEPVY